MHLIGALMMVTASASFGILKALDLRSRSKELHALIRSLNLLKHDLSARCLPLPDSVLHVSMQCDIVCRPFFARISDKLSTTPQSFAELWRSEAMCFSKCGSVVMDALADLGAHLGKYDAAAQSEAIDACVDTLQKAADRSDERMRQYGKLYAGLGLTIGSMLAVALY